MNNPFNLPTRRGSGQIQILLTR